MGPRLLKGLFAVLTLAAGLLAASGSAIGAIFGTNPVPVSVGVSGPSAGASVAGNGPSGGAAISGDDRRGSYVAFHSFAANLLPGDSNGTADVFVYRRPRGSRGTSGLDDGPARPAGALARASISSREQQANGPSVNPAIDGSVQSAPRCVAFQSQATNLAAGDRDRNWDIFVRDLRSGTTRLASRGLAVSAVNPAIDGRCRQVAFESGGRIWVSNARRSSRPRRVARGGNPDFSLDGSALVWERGGGVYIRRGHARKRTSRVSPAGMNPAVSDAGSSRVWAVVFDTRTRLARGDGNDGFDVYVRGFRQRGGPIGTDLISASRRGGQSLGGDSHNGGITAYAWHRGILVFVNNQGARSTLWYRNNNSGNIDNLAAADSPVPGRPAIFEPYTSARANFVAFSSVADSFRFDGNGAGQDVFLKHLIDGAPL